MCKYAHISWGYAHISWGRKQHVYMCVYSWLLKPTIELPCGSAYNWGYAPVITCHVLWDVSSWSYVELRVSKHLFWALTNFQCVGHLGREGGKEREGGEEREGGREKGEGGREGGKEGVFKDSTCIHDEKTDNHLEDTYRTLHRERGHLEHKRCTREVRPETLKYSTLNHRLELVSASVAWNREAMHGLPPFTACCDSLWLCSSSLPVCSLLSPSLYFLSTSPSPSLLFFSSLSLLPSLLSLPHLLSSPFLPLSSLTIVIFPSLLKLPWTRFESSLNLVTSIQQCTISWADRNGSIVRQNVTSIKNPSCLHTVITFFMLVCYHSNHVYSLTDVNRISKPSMHSMCVWYQLAQRPVDSLSANTVWSCSYPISLHYRSEL